MDVEELGASSECLLADNGVGVQEEDILACCLPYGLVVGSCEAYILGVLDVVNFGEELPGVFDGAVGGGVVHDPYFGLDSFAGFCHAIKALY